LQVEYRLGSGCPKVTIQRTNHPDKPIVFDWNRADPIQKTRNDLSKYDDKTVEAEHKRRVQLRKVAYPRFNPRV